MNHIVGIIKNNQLTDFFQVGLILSNENEIELITNNYIFFLEFNERYIKIEYREGRVCVSNTDNIVYENIPDIEGLPSYKNSIIKFIVTDDDVCNQVERIVTFNEQDCLEGILCDSLLLEMNNNQIIFFDPSYHWGINIGGYLQLKNWYNNQTQKELLQKIY